MSKKSSVILTSLFDEDQQFIDTAAPAVPEAVVAAGFCLEELFVESMVPESIPEQVLEPELPRENFSETKWIEAECAQYSFPVLARRTKKGIVLQGVTPMAEALLGLYDWDRHLTRQEPLKFQPLTPAGSLEKPSDARTIMTFALEAFLETPEFRDCPVYRSLEELGVTPVFPPSLAGFLRREWRRRKREATSFNMPNVSDTRSLFDRCEPGTLLLCTEQVPGGKFFAGNQYVVVDMKAKETSENLSEYEEGTIWLKDPEVKYMSPHSWSPADGDLEPYFKPVVETVDIYDPEKCVPVVYKDLYETNLRKLQKKPHLWEGLYLHARVDAAQAACFQHVLLGDPMRLGKTSKAIAIHEITGSQRIGVVTPKNGRLPFYKELKRLGVPDEEIVMVKSMNDIDKPGRYYLMTFNWLKRGNDPVKGLPKGSQVPREFEECPHCKVHLVRPEWFTEFGSWNSGKSVQKLQFTDSWGFMCRNKECTHMVHTHRVSKGAAWGKQDPYLAKGYVDFDRAAIAYVIRNKWKTIKNHLGESIAAVNMQGRRESLTGVVLHTWKPQMARRLRKRFNALIYDEIHVMKTPTSDQSRALNHMRAKRRTGMTGTLMPNVPADAFNPLAWVFVPKTPRFPWEGRQKGLVAFNDEFTSSTIIQTSETTGYSKSSVYLKKPIEFWKFMAPKMLRRSYTDPLVVESFGAAGVQMPTWKITPVPIQPSPEQAKLLVKSIDAFTKIYEDYNEEVKQKAQEAGKSVMLNSAMILSRMLDLRRAATCPGYLAETGIAPEYQGPAGGCKMKVVRQTVAEQAELGKKVLILSDFRYMQKELEKELFLYDPILFDTSWNDDERADSFHRFQTDPKYKVFIAGPRAVKEAIDLSQADTCICVDLLWTPGLQSQAWSRILTPRPHSRECQILLFMAKYSIDNHVYNTFYSKLIASEQALDRRVISKKEKGIDIRYFVDAIVSERQAIMDYILEAGEEEMTAIPILANYQFALDGD